MLKTTKSVCPHCLRVLDAVLEEHEDGIYMQKTCPEHGSFQVLVWEGNAESWRSWDMANARVDRPENAKAEEQGCPLDCGLCEAHERNGCCVLLELTRRCNLRCPVCFASAGEEDEDPGLEEIGGQMDWLMAHGGPYNLQLSGGEPTMRDDLPEIIRMGLNKGFTFFQLNTNGLRLAAQKGYARELKEAGLSTVFLSSTG